MIYVSSKVLLVACIASIASLAMALPTQNLNGELPYTDGSNGKPTCTVEEEISKAWRNNNDPTRFWWCAELNSEAIDVQCPINGGFLDGICVPWYMWQWTAPFDPPTLAE